MKIFRTLELAIEFNDRVNELKISGHLRDQLLRASSSIALNLSEGNAKFSPKEKKRFYQTAYASQKECQTILNQYLVPSTGTASVPRTVPVSRIPSGTQNSVNRIPGTAY